MADQTTTWITDRPVPLDFGGPVGAPFEPIDPEQAGIGRFLAVAARRPDAIAIDDGQRRRTFAEVRRATAALAEQLVRLPQGRPTVALLRNTADFPAVFLAHLATGRPLVPIDAGDPPERQAAILAETVPAAMILGPSVDPRGIAPGTPILQAGDGSTGPDTMPDAHPDLDDPAGVAFTSGSTGRPKGLAFSQRQFVGSLSQYVGACHISASDRLLGMASLSGAGCRDALAALFTGATLRIVDLKSEGLSGFAQALAGEPVTVLSFVPSVLRSLLRLDGAREGCRRLRILDLFGDRTTATDLDFFETVLPATCHIRLSLASTEATDMFSWFIRPDALNAGEPPPCGYLAAGKAIAVIDEVGASVPLGQVGELVVRGRTLALGAWQAGRLLPGPFLPDPEDPRSRIFHTGDLVRLRPDGLAEFTGRRDRQIKIRGLRADPADLEAVLRSLPGVDDAAVVAQHSDEGASLVAFIAAPASRAPTLDSMRDALSADLPPHLAPAAIHVVPSIPRLASFKVDSQALERLSRMSSAPESPTPTPGGELLDALRDAWLATFAGPFEADRPFDEAGIDSLGMMRFLYEVGRQLHRVPPLDIVTARMTPRQLAARLASLPTAADQDDRPIVFLVRETGAASATEPLLSTLDQWFRFEILPNDVHDLGGAIEALKPAGPIHLIGWRGTDAVLAELDLQSGPLASRMGMLVRLGEEDLATDVDTLRDGILLAFAASMDQ